MESIVSPPSALPDDVTRLARDLGGRIRTARLRRKWRQEDLAARTGLSRSTIQAVERGETATALGAYLHILWMLGLAAEVALLADPGLDRDGLALALDVERKRAYLPRRVDDDF